MAAKKAKRKDRQSSPPVQKVNRESYFSSGRIKRLAQSDYYTTLAALQEDIVFVVLTREHVNGRLAYALFGIQIYTGQLLECLFDFNFERDLFEDMKAKLHLERFEDRQSLELMIYEAMLTHEADGLPPAPGLRFGKNILFYAHEALKKTSHHHNHLFPFQNQPENNRTDDDKGKTSIFKKKVEDEDKIENVNLNIRRPLTKYNPQAVKDWSAKNWLDFIGKTRTQDPMEVAQSAMYNPLLFIFEKHLLPREDISDKIMAALERLEDSHPVLTQEEFWERHYDPAEGELLLQQGLMMELERAQHHKAWVTICKKLEDFLQKHPGNPIISNELHRVYNKLNYNNKDYKLICEFYKKYPNNPTAVANYFGALVSNNKPTLINQFLAKGLLLEDHLPEQHRFTERIYHYYYIQLAKFLYYDDRWNESWRLITYFNNLPEIQDTPVIIESWRSTYFHPAHNTFDWLTKIQTSEDIKTELIESITN